MQRRRIAVTLFVVLGIVLLTALLMMAGPSLMNAIIAMHSR